jgi:hypothetical protein
MNYDGGHLESCGGGGEACTGAASPYMASPLAGWFTYPNNTWKLKVRKINDFFHISSITTLR